MRLRDSEPEREGHREGEGERERERGRRVMEREKACVRKGT